MDRKATITWYGSGKTGTGKISTQSKALDNAHYAWNTRFENEPGTNPEELIAAAHAGCFTLWLSFLLNDGGLTADEIETTCSVMFEKADITKSPLSVKAKIPGIGKEKYEECVERAKNECPVSKALKAQITTEALLEWPAVAD